jgi:hypothetical protein
MKRSNILLTFVAAGALAAGATFAQRSSNSEPSASSSPGGGQQNTAQRHDMECSHYMAMNASEQMATVNSMRTKMPAADKMPSSREVAKKVAASCKDHPAMMVHEVLDKVMPQTSVMPH